MSKNLFNLNASYYENKNEELNIHTEYKQLCQYIYHNGNPLPYGYKVIGYAYNFDDGFYAEVVRKGKNLIIVSCGTENLDINDFKNDGVMSTGKPPSQYYSLMELYNSQIVDMKDKEPDLKVTFIGHSLAGTISQLGAITTGEDAVTFSAFGGEGLLPNSVKKVSAHIINYGNEDDIVFVSRIDSQIGEVRLIDVIGNFSPHKLEYWSDLREYVPYNKGNESHITPETYVNIKEKRYLNDIIKNKIKFQNFSSNILDYSSDKYQYSITNCPGSYPVKGYTREDGTKVQAYTRDCYKHKGSVPKLDNLSFEELERWIKELI